MNIFLVIFGCLGLIFRIWVNEIKLKKQLKYERHFTSRFLAEYFFIAMIFSFQNDALNLVVACTYPMMVICIFVFDIPFFIKLKQNKSVLPGGGEFSPEKVDLWVILERLTLHIPIVVVGSIWYPQGLKSAIFPNLGIGSMIFALIMVYGIFIFVDPRIGKKRDWPDGLWLMIGGILWTIGFILHFYVLDFA
ncbi:hypothetical protein [Candidatus Lokiarchaeum ossiferum]|uniref:hypothetical protein n=1 Tax=Candidatus Lokiarchaeum ossiferum TaxID=2951803 RepID=UPI00352EE944